MSKKPKMTLDDYLKDEQSKLANMNEEEKKRYLQSDQDSIELAKAMGIKVETIDLDSDEEIPFLTLDNLDAFLLEVEHVSRDQKTSKWRDKIWFIGLDIDIKSYLSAISKVILDAFDCDIYYLKEQPIDYAAQAICSRLSQIKAIVLFVSQNLIEQDDQTLLNLIIYLKENQIPMNPIIFNTSVNDFNRVIGSYEAILYQDNHFKHKLTDSLSQSLTDEAIKQSIDRAFLGRAFISYRKKDYLIMQKFVSLFADIDYCDSFALWYDDFLTMGEDFNEEIQSEIKQCDLFILLVTPHLLEEGNYVMTDEYPAAVKQGKRMIIIVGEETDKKMLKNHYPGVDRIIDIGDEENIKMALSTTVNLVIKEQSMKDIDEYHLALAHYHGYRRPMNKERASILMLSLARAGDLKATHFLAVHWDCEKYIDSADREEVLTSALGALNKEIEAGTDSNFPFFWDIARTLSSLLSVAGQWRKASTLMHRMISLSTKIEGRKVERLIAIGKIYVNLTMTLVAAGANSEAKETLKFAIDLVKEIHSTAMASEPLELYFNLCQAIIKTKYLGIDSQAYFDLGNRVETYYDTIGQVSVDGKVAYLQFLALLVVSFMTENNKQSINKYLQVFLKAQEEMSGNLFSRIALSSVLNALGVYHYKQNKVDKAVSAFEKAFSTLEEAYYQGELVASYLAQNSLIYGILLFNMEEYETCSDVMGLILECAQDSQFNETTRLSVIVNSALTGAKCDMLKANIEPEKAIEKMLVLINAVEQGDFDGLDTSAYVADFCYRIALIYYDYLGNRGNAIEFINMANRYLEPCKSPQADDIKKNLLELYHRI